MAKSALTADTLDRVVAEHIRRRFEDGATLPQMAEELGICDRTVMRYMRLLGLRRNPPPVTDDELRSMHAEGLRPGEIAERTGLHRGTVNNRLARLGLMGGMGAKPKGGTGAKVRGGKTRAKAVNARSRRKLGCGLAVDMAEALPDLDLTKFECMTFEGSGRLTKKFNEQQRARWDAARKAKEAANAAVQPA